MIETEGRCQTEPKTFRWFKTSSYAVLSPTILFYVIKSDRFSCASSQLLLPPPSPQACHMCYHLSLLSGTFQRKAVVIHIRKKLLRLIQQECLCLEFFYNSSIGTTPIFHTQRLCNTSYWRK